MAVQGKARMSNVMEDINELCQYDSEYEWFEFKENWYKPDELGEYKSAISNSLFTGTVYQRHLSRTWCMPSTVG